MQQYQHIFDGKLVKRDNISNAHTRTHTYFRKKTNAMKDRCTHRARYKGRNEWVKIGGMSEGEKLILQIS